MDFLQTLFIMIRTIKNRIDKTFSIILKVIFNTFKHITIKTCDHNYIFRNVKIKSNGVNNTIYIGKNVRLHNTIIHISGSNNKIIIGNNITLNEIRFAMYDDYNIINIGNQTYIGPRCHLATCESTSLSIGENCLIAEECQFRTSDSHSIIDAKDGHRLNPAQNIEVGNHIWIGFNCLILKGSKLPDNTVIAAKSIITKSINIHTFDLVGGHPAKVLKNNINWVHNRI